MAGVTINNMRQFILDQYPNSMKFREKVLKMPTNQVIAIYHSLMNRKNRIESTEKHENSQKEEFHQIDIFEWLNIKDEIEGNKGTHTKILV